MSERPGPTILLIGGTITLESGTALDTRQRIDGDTWDFCLRHSLAGSEQWWSAAHGLVKVLLDAAGSDAWALVWTAKTVMAPKADGTFTRRRIGTVLKDYVDLMDADYLSEGKIDAALATARHRGLISSLRIQDVIARRPPVVFVGAFHDLFAEGTDMLGLAPLDQIAKRWPNAIMVLPHTQAVEQKVRNLMGWLSKGFLDENAIDASASEAFKAEYMRHQDKTSGLVGADLRISKFFDRGSEADASAAQAALEFVQSRYDLKVGFWDLTRDSVLRESVLERRPQDPAPAVRIEPPREFTASAAKRTAAKDVEKSARLAFHRACWPGLKQDGWRAAHWKEEGTSYLLPLAREIPSLFPQIGTTYVLYWSFVVFKKQSQLILSSPAGSALASQFVRDNATLLRARLGVEPESEKCIAARFEGVGWEANPKRSVTPREITDQT
ncbi:MAG: hypothetical protein HY904_00850 [Deltaproteobacteria bacterium]|nr:hypothetical protein [Deltaproteobacteria bacterium]